MTLTTIDENGNEKKESLVKIIRDEPLGNYSWDSSSSDKNDGKGINEWSQADLMYELNCDGTSSSKYCRDDITEGYLSDKTSGTAKWYNGQNNTQSGIHYFNRSIKKSELNKIAVVRWNLGGASTGLSALNSYNQERGTNHVSNPSDNISRTATWDGKIALTYPSDCGYASTDSLCRSDMSSQSNNIYNCQNDNWLFNSTWQWTLTSSSNKGQSVFAFSQTGWVIDTTAGNSGRIRPSLYLISDVSITGGTGENGDTYTIE